MAPTPDGDETLVLYGTSACHLCEVAEAMLAELHSQGLLPPFREIDISDDDALFERYGERIPVLQDADGRELGWPFDPASVLNWLAA